jgi:hypothetical protein
MPEEVANREQVEALAHERGDDLLFGGSADPSRVSDLLSLVNDVVQAYAHQYSAASHASAMPQAAPAQESVSEASVNEVLYELMGVQDRLTELARLVGVLRFAVEGADSRQVREVEREIALLARYLPESYRVDALVKAAKTPTRDGGELAQLYLDRCYKLAAEDYQQLQTIDGRIQALESSSEAAQP